MGDIHGLYSLIMEIIDIVPIKFCERDILLRNE